MMGLTPGPLVRGISPFVLTVPFVVSVECVLVFFFNRI